MPKEEPLLADKGFTFNHDHTKSFEKPVEIVKEVVKVEEPKVEVKVEEKPVEKPIEPTPSPYQRLIDAAKGRLESDIPMTDPYWKIKKAMQEEGRF